MRPEYRILLIFIALLLLLASCGRKIREEGDISGIYCRKYVIQKSGSANNIFESTINFYKLRNQKSSPPLIEIDRASKTVTLQAESTISGKSVAFEVKISVEESGVQLAFGYDRLAIENGERNKNISDSDFKELLNTWNQFHDQYREYISKNSK